MSEPLAYLRALAEQCGTENITIRRGAIATIRRIDNGWILTTDNFPGTVETFYGEWPALLVGLTRIGIYLPVGTDVSVKIEAHQ